MEAIVEELDGIVQSADAVLNQVTRERETLSQRIGEAITRRTEEINRQAEQSLQAHQRSAAEAAGAKIRRIAEDNQLNADQMRAAFDRHHLAWRTALVKQILET